MKIPLTAYVEPEIDAAVEKACRQLAESRSKYLRRIVFNDLRERGLLSEYTIMELAVEGNHQRNR